MFAVITVTRPQGQIPRMSGPWVSHVAEVHQFGDEGTDIRPAENVWILDLKNQTNIFAGVVASANSLGLAYRVLYFDKNPTEFIPRQSDGG